MEREAEARVFGRSRARHPGNLTAYVILVSFCLYRLSLRLGS
jgi:hypothetical protein